MLNADFCWWIRNTNFIFLISKLKTSLQILFRENINNNLNRWLFIIVSFLDLYVHMYYFIILYQAHTIESNDFRLTYYIRHRKHLRFKWHFYEKKIYSELQSENKLRVLKNNFFGTAQGLKYFVCSLNTRFSVDIFSN